MKKCIWRALQIKGFYWQFRSSNPGTRSWEGTMIFWVHRRVDHSYPKPVQVSQNPTPTSSTISDQVFKMGAGLNFQSREWKFDPGCSDPQDRPQRAEFISITRSDDGWWAQSISTVLLWIIIFSQLNKLHQSKIDFVVPFLLSSIISMIRTKSFELTY